jgi:glycolate oxidase FAD binding subunit
VTYAEALGLEPGAVVKPTSVDEVASVIAGAQAEGKAVVPWGGGMAQTYGYLPRRADVLLDMTGLNRVVGHEPGDLTVTVEAGATLAQVQEVLAGHNQFLPLDPPYADRATIGGMLATDAFGASRTGYGSARDWLIGIRVVDAQGRIVKGGGKVVKNVTGYDLPKLHVGALGTLGVIVEATFKVAPRPEFSRPISFALPANTGDAEGFLAALHRETTPAFSLLREMAGERLLFLLYSGIQEVVESERAKSVELAAAHGFAPTNALPAEMDRPFADPSGEVSPLIIRLAGCLQKALTQHEAVAAMGGWHRVDTLPGTGHTTAYLADTEDAETALTQVVEWADAHKTPLTVLYAPFDLRAEGAPLWRPLPPSLPLMRRLKEMLDPNATLNPGRFIGGI